MSLIASLIVISGLIALLSSEVSAANSYIGAVAQHNVWMGSDGDSPQARLDHNLDMYSAHVRLAKSKGAQVIVFPEFGLTANSGDARSDIYPFAVKIPEASANVLPCDNPATYNTTSSLSILYKMSCAAKSNQIVVSINTIDWIDCNSATDSKCPSDSHYQYNTDIVFDEKGVIVAKYHKSHEWPSFVGVYDQVPSPSQVVYNSSFGVTFGLFICFDIMFDDPAKELRKQGVRHFLYSVEQGDAGLHTLIKEWSGSQKAVVLASNLGAGSKQITSQDGSDCSGIIVDGDIIKSEKYLLGPAYPDENILVSTIQI